MSSRAEIDRELREIGDWAAKELDAIKERMKTARKNRGRATGGTIRPANIKREAIEKVWDCSVMGSPPPITLTALIAELLHFASQPDKKKNQPGSREWQLAIEAAAEYSEPPDPAFQREKPRKRATFSELEEAAGVTKHVVREWLRDHLFEFLADFHVARARVERDLESGD